MLCLLALYVPEKNILQFYWNLDSLLIVDVPKLIYFAMKLLQDLFQQLQILAYFAKSNVSKKPKKIVQTFNF